MVSSAIIDAVADYIRILRVKLVALETAAAHLQAAEDLDPPLPPVASVASAKVLHWTQRPENRDKLRMMHKRSAAARKGGRKAAKR